MVNRVARKGVKGRGDEGKGGNMEERVAQSNPARDKSFFFFFK